MNRKAIEVYEMNDDKKKRLLKDVQSYLKEHPDAKIKIVLTVPGEAVAVPMKKGPETETLKAEIDRILEEARENGKLAELSIKHFGRDLTKAE